MQIGARMNMVANFLDQCRVEFEAGNKWCLMQALMVCAQEKRVMPPWAAIAYKQAYDTMRNAEAKSWDEVFGRVYPKGTNFSALKKMRKLKWDLFFHVRELLKSENPPALNNDLFEKVGAEFHIGRSLASEYYYEAKSDSEKV
jgi:hypothetical protein